MQLLVSMRDSLTIFRPSNFKIFALVTLKSLWETYKVWLKYWGWLIAIWLVAFYLTWQINAPGDISLAVLADFLYMGPSRAFGGIRPSTILWLFRSLSTAFIIISLIISSRPSTGLKNYGYVKNYYRHILYALIWFFGVLRGVFLFFFVILMGLHHYVGPVQSPLINSLLWPLIILPYCVAVITLLNMLFLFDSDGTVMQACKSVWRALKMIIYNLPLYLCMGLLFYVLVFPLGTIASLMATHSEDITNLNGMHIVTSSKHGNLEVITNLMWLLLLLPLAVTIVTNLYVKRLHEHYNLYYQ